MKILLFFMKEYIFSPDQVRMIQQDIFDHTGQKVSLDVANFILNFNARWATYTILLSQELFSKDKKKKK